MGGPFFIGNPKRGKPMDKLKELRKKRKELLAKAQAKIAEHDERRGAIGAEMTGEQQAELRAMLAEANAAAEEAAALEAEIETRSRINEQVDAMTRGQGQDLGDMPPRGGVNGGQGVEYGDAFAELVVSGGNLSTLPQEVRAALMAGAVMDTGAPMSDAAEYRAGVRLGVDAAGGFLVPDEAHAALVQSMRLYGPMLDMAPGLFQIFSTPGVATLPIPTFDATGREGEQEAAEGDTYSDGGEIGFGNAALGGYLIKSPWVKVSLQFLLSAPAAMGDVLSRIVAEDIGQKGNRLLTTGTGVNQPQGIVTGASVGLTTPGVGSFDVDDVIRFVRGFAEGYRMDPSFRVMMSGTTKTELAAMRNADGSFVLTGEDESVLRLGQTRVRNMTNEFMPSVAAGAAPFVAGVMNKFAIRHGQNGRVALAFARDSKFQPGAGLAGHRFVDSVVTDTRAIKKMVLGS